MLFMFVCFRLSGGGGGDAGEKIWVIKTPDGCTQDFSLKFISLFAFQVSRCSSSVV